MSEMNNKKLDKQRIREQIKKVPIVRRLFHNTWLKLISLGFAIVLWTVVMSQTNPPRVKVVYDVPLEITGLETINARGLSLATPDKDLPDSVNVRVEVPMDDLSRVRKDNVRAYLDLSRVAGIGTHDVNISLSTMYGSALSASVSRVEVQIESLTTSIVPVRIDTIGKLAENLKLGNVVATPAQFQITGPETDVNRIVAAVANVNLSEITTDFTRSVIYSFVDKYGNTVESININSSIGNSVSVSVPVYPTKELPIQYENAITGTLKSGYLLEGIEISPQVVRVAAPKEVLKELESMSVTTIDLENVDRSFTKTLQLKKNADIYWTDVNEVDVIVRVKEEEATKTFTDVPVQYRNLAANHRAELYGAAVDIEVTMAKSALEKLSNEDIRIYVDLAGLGEIPDSTAELYVYLDTDLTYEYVLSTEKIVLRIDKIS